MAGWLDSARYSCFALDGMACFGSDLHLLEYFNRLNGHW